MNKYMGKPDVMKRMPSFWNMALAIYSRRGTMQMSQHKGFRIEGAVGYRDRTAHRYWPMPRRR
jgi:hypothetical protein